MSSLSDRRKAKQIERAIAAEDWSHARKLIRAWLVRAPDDHWLLTRLGLTYYEQRQYRKALHYEIKALQHAPYCPLAIWDYAGTLDMLGQTKKALILYRWLISWGEEDLAFGECGEGIQAARSLILDCYYRIGRIMEGSGQKKRALVSYRKHLSGRTRGTRSIYPLSEVRRRMKELESG